MEQSKRSIPRVAVTVQGDRGTREVEGALAGVDDHLDAGGVAEDGLVEDGRGESGHRHVGMIKEHGYRAVDGFAGEFRLVALDIDDDTGLGNCAGDLGNAVGAGGVIGAGQEGSSAEGLDGGGDTWVVRSDDDVVETTGVASGLDDMLDEGLSRLG